MVSPGRNQSRLSNHDPFPPSFVIRSPTTTVASNYNWPVERADMKIRVANILSIPFSLLIGAIGIECNRIARSWSPAQGCTSIEAILSG